jgi:hypothetical protein
MTATERACWWGCDGFLVVELDMLVKTIWVSKWTIRAK